MSVKSWDWSLRIFDHVDVQRTSFANLNVADRQQSTQNLHLCFFRRERDQVDAFHRAGVEAGFRSNGRRYGFVALR
jgi:hypothetical protein